MSRSKYLIFAIACCAMLITSIDTSIVSVAFPVFTRDFNANIILAGWTITVYQLVLMASSAVVGKLSDILGRKFTFMLWVSIFTVFSLLCSLAPNIEFLITFRFFQGIGGGGIMPAAIGIIAEAFPQSRQRAIGMISSIVPAGMIIGPNLGGFMVTSLGWRSLFWVNIPLGILILVGATYLLPRGKRGAGSVDYRGAVLVGITLGAFMVGLSSVGDSSGNMKWIVTGLLFAIALITGVFFARHELKSRDPIIDLELMRGRPFIASNIFNFFFGWVVGFLSLIPAYGVYVFGLSTLESGVMLTPRSIGMILASFVTSSLIVRWGYRRPMVIGSLFLAAGSVLLAIEPRGVSLFGIGLSDLLTLSLIVFLFGIGSGIVAPAANNACIELLPERVSTITGILGIFRMAGTTIGMTVSTLLLDRSSSMDRGFFIILVIMAVLILSNIGAIFNMPASPNDVPRTKYTAAPVTASPDKQLDT